MDGEIRKTTVIDAPPETVFRAISDEKEVTQWFPDHAKLEPKVDDQLQLRFLVKEKPVIEEKEGAEEHVIAGKEPVVSPTQPKMVVFHRGSPCGVLRQKEGVMCT